MQEPHRNTIKSIQDAIKHILATQYKLDGFEESNHLLSHITISMLVLHREETRKLIQEIMHKMQHEVKDILKNAFITFKKINYFSRINPKTQKSEVTLLYLEI